MDGLLVEGSNSEPRSHQYVERPVPPVYCINARMNWVNLDLCCKALWVADNHRSAVYKCSPLCFTCFPRNVCVVVCERKQGPSLSHRDLNTALKLHSCERPAALPGYPNTMCSIASSCTKLRLCSSFSFPVRRLACRLEQALTDASEKWEEKENVNEIQEL